LHMDENMKNENHPFH